MRGLIRSFGYAFRGIFYTLKHERNMRILRNVPDISINTFTEKDVVRHKLVQDIIKAYEKNEEKRK